MTGSYVIPHISNVRQHPNMCGPAALATVFNHWGIEITQEEIAADTFHTGMQATHGSDLLRFSRQAGMRAYSWRGTLRDVKRVTSSGAPLVIRHMASHSSPSPHYRVVVGYDDHASSMIVLDPARDGVFRIPYRIFNRLWRPCGKWALLVVPESHDKFADMLGSMNPVLHHDLGIAHLRAGDPAGAIREFTAARRSMRKSSRAPACRGWARLADAAANK